MRMETTVTRTDDPSITLRRLQRRLPPPAPSWTRRKLRALPWIVGVNLIVFVAWQISDRYPSMREFMMYNFLTSWPLLKAGHFWTLITSEFSHNLSLHIALNMVVLWSFGSLLERFLGTAAFLRFYFSAACVSSLAHCLGSIVIGRPETAALGASGAIAGLLMLYALIFPHQKILVFGIIPIPAIVGALFFVGLDIWGLVAQGLGGGLPIGHGAHLGGALCGFLYFRLFLRPHSQKRRPHHDAGWDGLGLEKKEALRFDEIRRKLTHTGPDGLEADELEFLREIRRRVLGDE